MKNSIDLVKLYKDMESYVDKTIVVEGWIRNHRKQKEFGFIDFYDGTAFKSIQVVYDDKLSNFEDISKFRNGSAIRVEGKLIRSLGKGQSYEIALSDALLLGDCDEDYPMQPKRHTKEFLREMAYLRPRTNLFQAVFRIRSEASMAIHSYFNSNGYVYFHAPILTASDCEGAGEMFRVTTLDDLKEDVSKDFFGKKTSLTVSGQLQAETFALAYKKTYTFGPTFRAENSNTKTHMSEFWMIEPEIAFCDLDGDMEIIESMLKYVVNYILEKCPSEIEFLNNFVDNSLLEKLNNLVKSDFTKITHHDAIELLINSGKDFEFKPKQGEDIAKEHEKFLTEHFNGPVFLTDWPKDIKAFYMKLNPDNKTVAAVDLIVPGSGELVGGSQREEDLDKLIARMKEMDVSEEELYWYINLRRFGGCVHSGFGMGFERLIMYLTGVENIRDVIPYPRTPNNCEF